MTINDVSSLLKNSDNYLILTHIRPDGDTLGSAAALCRTLRRIGKNAFILQNAGVTERFSFIVDPLIAPCSFAPENVICVDIADTQLFPENAKKYADKIFLSIDHHPSNKMYAEINYVDSKAAATGEIVADIINALTDDPFDTETATALYAALSTDTGCFRYANTTSHTLRIAADCFDAGINAPAMNRAFFESKTKARMLLERKLYDDVRFFCGNHIAAAFIDRAFIDDIAATEDDLDNLSTLIRQIDGVDIAICIIETAEGELKASVRTSKSVNASDICLGFGGGGHARAAGCTFPAGSSMKDSIEKLVGAAERQFENANGD